MFQRQLQPSYMNSSDRSTFEDMMQGYAHESVRKASKKGKFVSRIQAIKQASKIN